MANPPRFKVPTIQDLKKLNVWNLATLVKSVNMALEIFGHTTISKNRVEDLELDLPALCKEQGWWISERTLNYGVFPHEQTNLVALKSEAKSKKHTAD